MSSTHPSPNAPAFAIGEPHEETRTRTFNVETGPLTTTQTEALRTLIQHATLTLNEPTYTATERNAVLTALKTARAILGTQQPRRLTADELAGNADWQIREAVELRR